MTRAVLLTMVAVSALALADVAAQQPAAQTRFTERDFARLKWIEGRWKGSGPGKPFYETYRMTSATKLESQSFADESFATPTGNGSVYLEGDRILHESGASQWIAVRLTNASIEFDPLRNASNSFVWTRTSADAWTAVLKMKGRPDTIYQMTRVTKGR